jgi:drug/metabolite transporter (DMT)-like permease
MRPSRLLSYLILLLLTCIWGTTWSAIRVQLRGIPPFTGVALRFALAGAVLLGVALAMKVPLGRARYERRLWVVNAACTFCTSYGLVYWAEQWLPSGLTAVLFATFPLIVAVLAHFWIPGERLTAAAVVGVVVGFAGVAVLFSADLESIAGPRAVFVAAVLLISPTVSAVAQVAVKRWGGEVHPLSITAAPMLLTGGVMGTLAAIVERDRGATFGGPSVGALLYLALVGSALAFSLYFWLLRHLPSTQVSLVAYTAPVLAVFVGRVALDEPVTARMLAGSALVAAGVAVALRAGHAAEPARREAA